MKEEETHHSCLQYMFTSFLPAAVYVILIHHIHVFFCV